MRQTRLFTTWDERNRAKTSSVCCWKAAVGGWVGAPLDLGFLICTREAVPNPSAGPSAHAVHYQDSRLESSQERPDSRALRRWEAGWAAPLGLMCSSGRGLGIPISHRQSVHRLTELISYHRGVTSLHTLELSPGWRL